MAFALFETPLGTCGIAWGERGVQRLLLPGDTDESIRARLGESNGGELQPPRQIEGVIEDIRALMRGEDRDTASAPIDLSEASRFEREVYRVARTIPPGKTMTYGEVAARLGSPRLSRAVGRALGRNPVPVLVPCHRVVGAQGKPGGFSAPGGVDAKLRLLAIERAAVPGAPSLFGGDLTGLLQPETAKSKSRS